MQPLSRARQNTSDSIDRSAPAQFAHSRGVAIPRVVGPMPKLGLPNQTGIASGNLPAVVQPGTQRGQLVRVSRHAARAWVLHQRMIVLIVAGLMVAMIAAGAFYWRGGIMSASTSLGHVLSGRAAAAGIGISEISISGQALTREKQVVDLLAINPETTIFSFDAEAARLRLLDLPAVADVKVAKVYPSKLVIEIEEVAPVARWRVDGLTYLIDAAGDQLAIADPADTSLPIVIGDGAADDAAAIIAVLKRHPDLSEQIAALSRIADRRWDMIFETGLRVKLPENGVAQALNFIEDQQTQVQILDRDLDEIDLRVSGLMSVKVTQRESVD